MKRGGEEGKDKEVAAATAMFDFFAALILRLLGLVCAGIELVVLVILRGCLGDDEDAHGSAVEENASDIIGAGPD